MNTTANADNIGATGAIELCGPHTGVTSKDIELRAKVRQDYLAGDTLHGHVPTWDELPAERRETLLDQAAAAWLNEFNAPAPNDPRPIDHRSASSPPYPDGKDELLYWLGHCSREVQELSLMALPAGSDAFVSGRADEAERWFKELQERQHYGGHAEIGRDETAYWITWWQERVTVLAHRCDSRLNIPPSQAGELAQATDSLRRVRRRQQQLATPQTWRRGGRGLMDALRGLGFFPSGGLTDDMVIIAAHDANEDERTIMTRQRDVVATLARWTSWSTEACEQAIRDCARRNLVDGRTPIDVRPTSAGNWAYQRLLRVVIAGTASK